MRQNLRRTLPGLALIPTTALFIGLLTSELQHSRLGLAWPLTLDPHTSLWLELTISSLPGLLLFIVASIGLRRHGKATAQLVFVASAALSAYCAVILLAPSYGNTWSISEVFKELLLGQWQLFVLAQLPGLLLSALLHPAGAEHG